MAFRSLRLMKSPNSCQQCLRIKTEINCINISITKIRCYSSDTKLVTTIDEAKRFMKDCFIAVGTPPDHAEIVACNLLAADYRGHYSHGMNRLEMYIRDIQGGFTDAKAEPVIEKETGATAWVDGKNGLGAVVGNRCMNIAMDKAKDVGIGFVVAKGSNHYGIAGIYGLQAIEEGLLGLTFSNTSPFMTPTRAKEAVLGTNPLSLGAPGLEGESFLLDMATTAVAVGKIEIAKRKGEPIPEGWALNDEGMPETNPTVAYAARKLMPIGGTEENSGFKGYGLGMLVEILSGLLAGSAYGPYIRRWGEAGKLANLGQSFMAINPDAFAPGFSDRLTDLMSYIRKLQPANPEKPVVCHGDNERAHVKRVNEVGGLQYIENQHKRNYKLAEELKIKPMVSKSLKVHYPK